MEDFKKELSDLLRKHDVGILCFDTKNGLPHDAVIGFQDMINRSKITYTGRCHITWWDLTEEGDESYNI